MSHVVWYYRVSKNLNILPDFIEYYREQYESAVLDVKISGNLEKNMISLPGITELRFSELQDIESVLDCLNLLLKQIKQQHFKKYLENYGKALSSRDAEKYADSESDVVNHELLIAEVALIRNQYLSIIKGLEVKNWTLSNITKLRVAGLEDVRL